MRQPRGQVAPPLRPAPPPPSPNPPGSPQPASHPDEESVWVEQLTGALDSADSTLSAIGIALGAASMCWEHVDRAGVFQSDRASTICDLLHSRVTLGAVNWTP